MNEILEESRYLLLKLSIIYKSLVNSLIMHEQSYHEKEGLIDLLGAKRLSESRPKFKPVLVKKLLADESDDESDDQALNSDNSDEDFDDFQPLVDEISPTGRDTVTNVDSTTINDEEGKQKLNLNCYLKDSLKVSEYVVRNCDNEKFLVEQSTSGAKRKICKDLTIQETASNQSQWTSKSMTILDKRKSSIVKEQSEVNVPTKSYSPNPKRQSYNVTVNKLNDIKENPIQNLESVSDLKDKQECLKYSANITRSHNIHSEINDEKIPVSNKVQVEQISSAKCTNSQTICNNTMNVLDTPMKQPQGSTRPNPCVSHRNIFQTPQNKASNEFMKNPIQTPATIFSHWSQHHMAQTPMQNQVSTRESMHTPASSIIQSQNARHETPRYLSGECKSTRRPLAETMRSSLGAQPHGSLLPRLQELPNESQPSPLISRELNNAPLQETVEKKPLFSSSLKTHESKENWNPMPHNITKNESHTNTQPKVSISEIKHSLNSHLDNKPKQEYRNTYSNVQTPRPVENYEKYQSRENQNIHPPVVTNQPETIQTIQWNLRNNKIITVKDHQYLVLGVIGQGMSCEVVRAQDLSTSELRAIKCVNLSKMDKDSAQGCLQEICMLDRLKDPCIVHMYSFEIKQPWVHVVMEIGDTDLSRLLKSMLQEKNKIPLTMILYYWTEMLTAVKHIHKNGVIHSDLKPANFLLVRGRLKLIDFGIASNINADMTSVLRNNQIGTLNYISPEALMEVNAGSEDSPNHNVKYKISYKSDVWSLGCILYSLVYGVTPFLHIRPQWAKISAITDPKNKINFPLVSGSEPVPLILIDVMRKCLQRDPKVRPTVSDLLDIKYLESNITPHVVPNIPSKILMKIKLSLPDEEWKQFIEILDKK